MKTKLWIRISLIALLVLSVSTSAFAALPVIDAASVAQLVQQIEQFSEMIDTLHRQYQTLRSQYEMLRRYAEIDHDGLAARKFRQYLDEYTNQFQEIVDQIGSYQNGGLLGNISRLDEIYSSYHTDWQSQDREGDFTYEADTQTREIKKLVLWNKIQLKHAALVAAKVRDSLPIAQDRVNTLLNDTSQAEGILLTAQIGNELMGEVAKSVNVLNTQITELTQAEAAEGLEKNQRDGHRLNRGRESIDGWGERDLSAPPSPLNPFGAY